MAKGVSGLIPHESDREGEVTKSVEDSDGGVADGLRLRDEVSKGDACLRFLVDNSNRHRRVVGIRDSCEFVLSEVDDGTFRLGAMCEVLDLNFLRLRLHGTGDNFSVNVAPEEDVEATDAHEAFFLPLRVLNNIRRLFFAIRFFFAFRARGVSFSSHLRSDIFCLKTFSQQVSSYTSLLSPSSVTMQHKSSVYSYLK